MTVAQSTLKAQVEVPGAIAQVIEYRWGKDAVITMKPDRSVLLRRSKPTALTAVAVCGAKRQKMGHLSFAPADVSIPVYLAQEDEHALLVTCRYEKNWLSNAVGVPDHWEYEDIIRCIDVQNDRIDQAMRLLGMELMSPGLSSSIYVESITKLMAVEFSRHISKPKMEFRARTTAGKLTASSIRNLTEYIKSRYDHCPSLDELSRLFGISSTHLRKSFKNTTGKTIHQYVDEIRLAKARSMLSHSDLALKEVAYRLGYAAPNAFAHAFRKVQGETPSEYRRRFR